ncbi:MAG TPA: phosphomannomutase/phosphoglucomutase [Ruminococcaceae bacterium]|nr:phosphomannomutase/phosphoglucomutase [Oscillospiraceae bacterium]
MSDWMKYKSGTDVRGIAVGESDGKIPFLSDEAVRNIVLGFVDYVGKTDGLTVAVGHDCRVSAPRLKNAVIVALTDAGVNVMDCGLSSTPAMFMTTVELGCQAAIQLTASHHPWDKNGLKFFLNGSGIDGKQLEQILKNAENPQVALTNNGTVEQVNFMPRYAEILRNIIIRETGSPRPLSGMKIAVDAGNGVGGFYATEVLEKLGADVSGSRYLEPDGTFPNHIPNPENKQAMEALSEAVVSSGSELGLVFDTDVDRAACVDKNGTEIARNRLVALAAAIALEGNDGGTIVTDSIVSDGLTDFINHTLGGVILPYKRGYKNVIDKQIELNNGGVNCPLAIETSGHAAFRENYYLDDGAYLAAKIVIKLVKLKQQGKELEELFADLEEAREEKEVRFKILCEDFKAYGEMFLNDLRAFCGRDEHWQVVPNTYEGVRINADETCGDGWLLARLSVHDPVIPVNFESRSVGGTKAAAKRLLTFAKNYDKIDISALTDFCENG